MNEILTIGFAVFVWIICAYRVLRDIKKDMSLIAFFGFAVLPILILLEVLT